MNAPLAAANDVPDTLTLIQASACSGFIAHILRHMNLFLDAFSSCCFLLLHVTQCHYFPAALIYAAHK